MEYTLEQLQERLDFSKDVIQERQQFSLPTCVICQRKIKGEWRWIYVGENFSKCVCWACKEHYE